MKHLLILLLLTGCTAIPHSKWYLKTELYFGLSENGREITEKEWTGFREDYLDKMLTGYTEVKADGYWSQDGQSLHEPSKLLIYVHKAVDRPKIDSVISAYKRLFHQQSVLKVERRVQVQF